jgi:hypothetical protein
MVLSHLAIDTGLDGVMSRQADALLVAPDFGTIPAP